MPAPVLSKSTLGLCAGLLAYAVLLSAYVGAVAGGSDNSGYFNEARVFSRLSVHAQPRALPGLPVGEAPPYLYVPLGFKPAVDGTPRMVPTYPPGLPLMLAPVGKVAGWRHAGDILLILHSLAGIALTYALGRMCGLPAPWPLLGAAILAASPLYLYTSLQALSDVPATAWAAAAVLAAWRSRERTGWALASGVALAVAFLLRPSNFLIGIPMLLAFGLSPRRWGLAAAGAVPGIAAWMAINHAAYGGVFLSGYGAIGKEFHAGLVPGTLRYCARWLPLLLGPVVLVAPAFVALFRYRRRWTAVLAAWIGLYLGFYSAYRWTHEDWWFLRFLLPAAPALIVGCMIVVQAFFDGLRSTLPKGVLGAALAVLFAASLSSEVIQTFSLDAWTIGRGERKYGRVLEWAVANLPRNTVVVANQFSGAMLYFTDFTFVRGDQIDPTTAVRIQADLSRERRPLYAILFPFERDLAAVVPCRWTIVRSFEDVLILRGDWVEKNAPK